jgi:folate-binding protein YgfZ
MLSTREHDTIAILRQKGGSFVADAYGLIEIYGKDAARFLQSQTTNDVDALNSYCGQFSCLLDRKAYVKAFFQLYRRHESFRIIAEKSQIPAIISHLVEYKFADKVELLNLTETGQFFAVQGPDAPLLVRQAENDNHHNSACNHDLTDAVLLGYSVHVFRKSVTGETGYFFWIARSDAPAFIEAAQRACKDLGLVQIDSETLEIARIEAGLPKYGTDFGEGNILPETALEDTAVSYTKGCFLGQEVLARIKSHGASTRALVGLNLKPEAKERFALDTKVMLDGTEIALLKSNAYSPTFSKFISFASIKRDWRVPGKRLTVEINNTPYEVEVSRLPFYEAESIEDRARRLYSEGLKLYTKESEKEVESDSVRLLRQAIQLDPSLEDAYEALGVILSKRERLDEAIELMKKLATINEDSIMAHTNLSVFYLEKGNKDAAEEEKAISMSIRMRLASKEAMAAQAKEKSEEQKRQETMERMEMFKQVLAIDENDLLANYGYGSCLVDLGRYAEAISFLEKAIAVKPAHTVAYIALAKAYEGTGNKDKRYETINKGIEVAAKRGDVTPLKELEKMLGA